MIDQKRVTERSARSGLRAGRGFVGKRGRWAVVAAACALLLAAGPVLAQQYDWKTLRVGAGGWLTGMDIAPDGTRVVRTDTYGAYKWNAATSEWEQLVTTFSMPAADAGLDRVAEGVFEIRIAPSNSSIMYMALRGYVYKTTNGGTTWVRTGKSQLDPNDSLVANGVADRYSGEKMAVDPRNPDVVYLGSRRDGMFATDDGGASWRSVSGVSAGRAPGITGICFDATSGVIGGKTAVIYASSAGTGIYRSTDAGASWSQISNGSGGTPTEALHAECANGRYYVTNAPGTLWKYDGSSWSNIEPGENRSHTIAVDPSTPGRLVVGFDSGHLRVSHDDGASWSPVQWNMSRSASNIPWHAWTGESYMSNGDMQFDPTRPGRLYFSQGIGVWYTDISTGSQPPVTWKENSVGIEQLVANVISAPPGSSAIHLAGWDRGVFTTSDVDAYPSRHGPVQAFNHAWWVGHAATDPNTIVAMDNYNGKDFSGISRDAGATWSEFPSDTPTILFGGTGAASTPSNIILIGSGNGPGYYTTNGGSSWTPLSLPGTSNSNYHPAFFLNRHIVAADSVTPNKFYLYKCVNQPCSSSEGLFRSVDGGATWTKIRSGNLAAWDGYSNAKLKAVPGKAGHLFYTAGWLGGANPADTNLMRTSDSGDSWSAVPNVKEVYDFGFGDMQPSGYPSIFIAGFVGGQWGIWRSDDAAASWTQIGDFPLGSFDLLTYVEGAKDGTDRVFIGYRGSGYAYGAPASGGGGGGGTGGGPPPAPVLLP